MQLAVHWGKFNKSVHPAPGTTGAQLCLQIAETALRRHGLHVFDPADQPGDSVVAARTADGEIIVQIICVPAGATSARIIVSAFSNSSTAAEQMRNLIRSDIVAA